MLRPTTKSNYAIAPAGTHSFCCYRVLDLGTQYNATYKTNAHCIALFFELIGSDMGDGRPFSMSKKFTLKLGSKKKPSSLRTFLESWIPLENFEDPAWDLSKLLLKTGVMLVSHDKSADGSATYANIKTVMPPMPGVKLEYKLYNTPGFVFLDESFDGLAYGELTDYWKDLMAASPEFTPAYNAWLERTGSKAPPSETPPAPDGDDIPF